MTVRREVQELVTYGMPSEDAPLEEIEEANRLLENIAPPVSDEDAQLLATAFGSDDCYGMAATLMHLIETAPGAHNASYSHDPHNMWVKRLNDRVEVGREIREAR
ncbi:hypothetical protein [Streptomyces rimosus]|uniref:hypothetical protein n=1 Tax=Streptomyces rimosus TaxID=1927 RepID=UPI0012FF1C41|nr:hypothetical protein [Streptomyces rimosus]